MSGISLTAPMRSNLLALQNIARQQDIVQNRLATGLKVSSAIDNPSSYYTAASLSNRAADLSALLDAMSQGVQTIKTASEAISSATKFLEQAKATASQALESAIPAKSWFEEQVGENGAVVTTAQELQDAVNAGKETICVYGKIEFAHNQTLNLQANQKLVGIGYFGKFDSVTDKFSALYFSGDTTAAALSLNNNCLLSDLTVNYYNHNNINTKAIATLVNCSAEVRNADVFADLFDEKSTIGRGALMASAGGYLKISGQSHIETSGFLAIGLWAVSNGKIETDGDVSVLTHGYYAYGMLLQQSAQAELGGRLKVQTEKNSSTIILLEGAPSKNLIHINSNAEIILEGSANFIGAGNNGSLQIDKGAKIALKNPNSGEEAFLKVIKDFSFDNTTGQVIYWDIADLLQNMDYFSSYQGEWASVSENKTNSSSTNNEQNQYTTILEQYNMLIADSSYKGINLLQGQNLQINFNEDRSSKVEVKGVKADSESLGLVTKEWANASDIEKSISELENAINSLRSFASAFGNYYSIVTTRQDFTENLINVLEEGADKLTLADMNEESANMLALQTSQQLAINSLSLASQAAQSVLKLF